MFKPLARVAAVLTAFSLNAFAKTELTVYTALEAEQLKTYKKAFEQANPDVEIKWVRDSTGIITAKLLAEKARPQADAVWGLAATPDQAASPKISVTETPPASTAPAHVP